jgi:uncharacterized membrane protein
MEKEQDILNTVCKNANIQSSYDIFLIKNSQVSTFTVILSLLWILILIAIVIFIIWCVYKLIKSGWSCYKENTNSPMSSPVDIKSVASTSVFKKNHANKRDY